MNGKVVAGVARGLGTRFDIDANIVRVIFVVLACVWGLGVAIYLAMWVFVPRAEDEEAPLARRSRPPTSTSHRLSSVLVVGVIVALVLFALIATHGPGRAVPSLALAWLAFLVALAVIALRTSARRLTFRRVVAIALLAGLSVLILAVGALVGFLDSTGVSLAGGNGVHVWQPTALSGVRHHYDTEFGGATIELTAVTFPASGFVVYGSTAVGTLRVVVPSNAVVSVTTHVGIGVVRYVQGADVTGAFAPFPAVGPNAVRRRAPHLVLDVRVGIGRLTLTRARASSSTVTTPGGHP